MKGIFPWSPLQTICRYLRLCYHRKKEVRKWTYFSIILKFITDCLGVKPSHWLLWPFCLPAHTQAVVSAEALIAPRHLCCSMSSQGSEFLLETYWEQQAKASAWWAFHWHTIRPDLHASFQRPSKVLHLFWHSTKEKHRNNLILFSLHGFLKNSKESQVYNIAFNFLEIQQFSQLTCSY